MNRPVAHLLAALIAGGAFASTGCVPPTQVAALQDDVTALRAQVDDLRGAGERQAEEIRSLRALVESSASTSQETRADLELRLKGIEERQSASIEQGDQSRERLESLAADITALRNQITARGIGAASPGAPISPGAPAAEASPPAVVPAATADGGAPAPEPPVAATERIPEAVQDLFNAAYADYSQGRYPLAIKGFEEIVRSYGQTELADNARYWIGVSRLDGGDAPGAIAEFDRLLRDYPTGDRVAPALLKKGLALLQIDRKEAGVAELRALITRFPASDEARVARGRLASLGVQAG